MYNTAMQFSLVHELACYMCMAMRLNCVGMEPVFLLSAIVNTVMMLILYHFLF
jgi:hypothetical protein